MKELRHLVLVLLASPLCPNEAFPLTLLYQRQQQQQQLLFYYPDNNNLTHQQGRRPRRGEGVLLHKAAFRSDDFGINWNSIMNNKKKEKINPISTARQSTNAADADDKDVSIDNLAKMQTDIGALIQELQNKHNSNGKEAVLQAKLTLLSRDLEAYRAVATQEESLGMHKKNDMQGETVNGSHLINGSETKSWDPKGRRIVQGSSRQHEESPSTETQGVNGMEIRDATTTTIMASNTQPPRVNGCLDNRLDAVAEKQKDRISRRSVRKKRKKREKTANVPSNKETVSPLPENVNGLDVSVRGLSSHGDDDAKVEKTQPSGSAKDPKQRNTKPPPAPSTPSGDDSKIPPQSRDTTAAIAARQDYFKRRIEETRQRAMENAARRQNDSTKALAQSTNDENKDNNDEASSSRYLIEIKDENMDELDDDEVETESPHKRFGEPPSPKAESTEPVDVEHIFVDTPRRPLGTPSSRKRRFGEPPMSKSGKSSPPPLVQPSVSEGEFAKQTIWEAAKPPDVLEPPRYRRFGEPPMNTPGNQRNMADVEEYMVDTTSFANPTSPPSRPSWVDQPRKFGEPPLNNNNFGSDPATTQHTVWQSAQDWLQDSPTQRLGQPPMPDSSGGESSDKQKYRKATRERQQQPYQQQQQPPQYNGRQSQPPFPEDFFSRQPDSYQPTMARQATPPPQQHRVSRPPDPIWPGQSFGMNPDTQRAPPQQRREQPYRSQPGTTIPPQPLGNQHETQVPLEPFAMRRGVQSHNHVPPRRDSFRSPSKQDTFDTHPQDIDMQIPRPREESSPIARVNAEDVVDAVLEDDREEESDSSAQETTALDEPPVCIWDTPFPIVVEGTELRTWSFDDDSIERVQVFLKAEAGKPLHASVDLWHGPDDTPQKMTVFLENGSLSPFSAVIETPVGHNSVAVRNTAESDPIRAAVVASDFGNGSHGFGPLANKLTQTDRLEKEIDGGQSKTWPVAANVSSVQVLLRTYKRPLNARVELVQKGDDASQCIDIYTEDGFERPFYIVMETPGEESTVRIVNTGFEGFPLDAIVEPNVIDTD